jgi:hypothetical protein
VENEMDLETFKAHVEKVIDEWPGATPEQKKDFKEKVMEPFKPATKVSRIVLELDTENGVTHDAETLSKFLNKAFKVGVVENEEVNWWTIAPSFANVRVVEVQNDAAKTV